MTAREALEFAIEVATRNVYHSENADEGGNFGGTDSCEYGCGHVIADVLRQKLKEIE
jgi:hypothetical protein